MSDASMPHCERCKQPMYACLCDEEENEDYISEIQFFLDLERKEKAAQSLPKSDDARSNRIRS